MPLSSWVWEDGVSSQPISASADADNGYLPAEWRARPLADVIVATVSGDWGSEGQSEGFQPARVLRGTDFEPARRGQYDAAPVRFLKTSSLNRRSVAAGDLLVELSGGSKGQPTGRLLHLPRISSDLPLTFSNFVRLLRIDASLVDPAYFSLYWEHLYRAGRTRVYEKRTTGIRNFKLNDFAMNEAIALPPLAEQQVIASVLHAIERARESTEIVISAARDLKRSLMQHLFTYGPVPVAEVKGIQLRQTEIGPVPVDWGLPSIGQIIAIGPQNGLYKPADAYGSGTMIVRINDFADEGQIVTAAPKRVSTMQLENDSFGLKPGDILFNRVNSLPQLGKVALIGDLTETLVFESNMMRFSVDRSVAEPEFVFRWLCHPSVRQLVKARAKRAVAQSSVNQGDLKSIPVPLPSIKEQRQMVALLSAVDRKTESELARIEALRAVFVSALTNLMTGRRRVAMEAINA